MKVFAAPAEIAVPEFSLDIPAYEAACDKHLADVQEWARKNSQPHALVGEVVTAPAGDGQAVYVIAKFNRNLSLIHIATWDAWQSPMLEELATTAYLTKLVAQQKSRAAFWAERTEQKALADA